MDKEEYSCDICGKSVMLSGDESIPDCCGEKMRLPEALSICVNVEHAEMVRYSDDDDACDDSR